MKKALCLLLILAALLGLCGCRKETKLSTVNYADYFDTQVLCDISDQGPEGDYRVGDGIILVSLKKKTTAQVEVDYISVEVTLEWPWSFDGSRKTTAPLEAVGDGTWYAKLDCSAKSLLVNTSFRFSPADIQVEVRKIVGVAWE